MDGVIDEGGLGELLVASSDPQPDAIKDAEPASLTMSRRYRRSSLIGSGRARAGLPVWPPSRGR
ncbi:hypothetical protein GCM10023320_81550 [Pseudonocardia adelaidensis]|uniref:Uncharacterized protein n=1 Tax=Pseudonocardia adelaidensis TaxID=648754 RepID=A0ABP9P739_9PSEU